MTPREASLLIFPGYEELPPAARLALLNGDFRLVEIDDFVWEQTIVEVLKHIDSLGSEKNVSEGAYVRDSLLSGKVDQTSGHRQATWERCYRDVDRHGDLLPPFLLPESGTPVRLRGRYEIPYRARFEADFSAVVRAFLFDRFFSQVGTVYEFGCGTGHNLLALAKQQPGKKVVGLEWSSAALEVATEGLKWRRGINFEGRLFDFFNPDKTLEFDTKPLAGSGVLTIGALEQVGRRFGSFLSFLLEKRPSICVHLEPIFELYNPKTLFDYVAMSYHRKRGYLEGFLPALQEKERAKRVEIIAVHRIPFGSRYHEAYTYVVWRPI